MASLIGVILMTLALIEVLNKSERRVWIIEPGPAIMVLTYLVGMFLAFRA